MKVRLTRKLANRLDGVDVSNNVVGDVLDLPAEEARLLVAEKWAMPERRSGETSPTSTHRRRADDRPLPPPPTTPTRRFPRAS
jgi:hypothetical protein